MSGMDKESRATRFLDAMEAVNDLLTGRVPGLSVDAVQIGQLHSLLMDEARHVVPSHEPRHRAASNDDYGDHE